jgi:SAM-dependent methyltransferase
MSELTSTEKEKLFQLFTDNSSISQKMIREGKLSEVTPIINFSDTDFLEKYVRNEPWLPFTNHGIELMSPPFAYMIDDIKYLYQNNLYCDLLRGVQIDNKKFLDVGCGFGRGVNVIKNYFGADIDGYDINETFINYAKEQFPNNNYYQTINFDNYDTLVFVNSLHVVWNSGLIHILKEKELLITDFFTADSLRDFKELIKLNNWKVTLEQDDTTKVIFGLQKDIDSIEKRFPEVSKTALSAYKHIQHNRLHQFQISHNKQYKYHIEC